MFCHPLWNIITVNDMQSENRGTYKYKGKDLGGCYINKSSFNFKFKFNIA